MAYRVPGPCTIEFGLADLGVTKQGIIIRPTTSLVPITDDHRGAVPGTYLFGGKSCTVEVIGMELSVLKDADIWDGGVLTQANTVGTLASTAGASLTITERDGTSVWIAALAFPTDPREINMKSTQELNVPLTFVIVNVLGKLFSTVPAYISA